MSEPDHNGLPGLTAYDRHVGITIRRASLGGIPGPVDVAFARQLADAAWDYANKVDALAGDPDAGAEFWASIDTCPDDCGCHR